VAFAADPAPHITPPDTCVTVTVPGLICPKGLATARTRGEKVVYLYWLHNYLLNSADDSEKSPRFAQWFAFRPFNVRSNPLRAIVFLAGIPLVSPVSTHYPPACPFYITMPTFSTICHMPQFDNVYLIGWR